MWRKSVSDKPEAGQTAEAPAGQRSGWFSGRRGRAGAGDRSVARAAPPPPPRKPRKSGLVGLFSAMLTIGLVGTLVLFGLFSAARRDFAAPGPLLADKTLVIEKGSSTEEIVDLLEKEGVISRPTWFWMALLFRDVRSKLPSDENSPKQAKAGEYLFKAGATMTDVLDTITSGRSIQHAITIPEGLTSEQIVERLKENDLLTGEVATIPAEGSLLPDTYKINRGTSREALLARMQSEHRKVLNAVWARRSKDILVKTPRELVTLASIVEKETGKADERPRVAGVFYNRLDKKMRLQSDPTIIYGLVAGKGSLGRGITRADIQSQTPYNTYVIAGLPPGPIANPGRAALEATANPSKVKDLFFVADGTGGHVFAETLAEHERNVARWRQIEAARGANPPPLASPGFPGVGPAAPTPGTRSALPTPDAPAALGFSAPNRRTDAPGLAPPPSRDTVGSLPERPNAAGGNPRPPANSRVVPALQ